MDRKFRVGDIIYPTRDAEMFGSYEGRLFKVVAIDVSRASGLPFVRVKLLDDPSSALSAYYEKGWALYQPPPVTEAGAEEYEEAMRGLDLVKIQS